MILGVLADTHGQRQRAAAAIRVLRREGAQAFVHCGDLGSAEVLEELAGLRAWVVCGNVDDPAEPLVRHAQRLGLTAAGSGPLRIELDGRTLVVFHGHESELDRLLGHLLERGALPPRFGRCDYLLHGHTHLARDVFLGPVRLINPGALHRASPCTVATLDLSGDRLRFWPVSDVPTTK
jgi:putative phosphoesterase